MHRIIKTSKVLKFRTIFWYDFGNLYYNGDTTRKETKIKRPMVHIAHLNNSSRIAFEIKEYGNF